MSISKALGAQTVLVEKTLCLRSRPKHIAQGEARLCERNPGIVVDNELAREARERLGASLDFSPAARAGFFTTLAQGSARKASLHPGLYALARFAGSEHTCANQEVLSGKQSRACWLPLALRRSN